MVKKVAGPSTNVTMEFFLGSHCHLCVFPDSSIARIYNYRAGQQIWAFQILQHSQVDKILVSEQSPPLFHKIFVHNLKLT